MNSKILINLTQDEAGELQLIASELVFNMKMCKAIETFDSSSMKFESQLTHKLMQLARAVKNEKYDETICAKVEDAKNEFCHVQEQFEIDKDIIKYLVSELVKESEKRNKIVEVYSDKESSEYDPTMASNYLKRIEFIDNATRKLLAFI